MEKIKPVDGGWQICLYPANSLDTGSCGPGGLEDVAALLLASAARHYICFCSDSYGWVWTGNYVT